MDSKNKLDNAKYGSGNGLRSIKSTTAFRIINFELYSKPNKIIMGAGIICLTIAFGYISYMRTKYESKGYYIATKDGKEVLTKKQSKWDM